MVGEWSPTGDKFCHSGHAGASQAVFKRKAPSASPTQEAEVIGSFLNILCYAFFAVDSEWKIPPNSPHDLSYNT